MRQYMVLFSKEGRRYSLPCTAPTPAAALDAVRAAYAPEFEGFEIASEFPAHHFYNELNAEV